MDGNRGVVQVDIPSLPLCKRPQESKSLLSWHWSLPITQVTGVARQWLLERLRNSIADLANSETDTFRTDIIYFCSACYFVKLFDRNILKCQAFIRTCIEKTFIYWLWITCRNVNQKLRTWVASIIYFLKMYYIYFLTKWKKLQIFILYLKVMWKVWRRFKIWIEH